MSTSLPSFFDVDSDRAEGLTEARRLLKKLQLQGRRKEELRSVLGRT
jgi:hypothetical protein